MDRRGNLIYLSIYEQMKSGYPSPINLDEFDLHTERELADAKLDELDKRMSKALDENFRRGLFNSEYERALVRSSITRNIAKSIAQDTLVIEGLEQIEQFLTDPEP